MRLDGDVYALLSGRHSEGSEKGDVVFPNSLRVKHANSCHGGSGRLVGENGIDARDTAARHARVNTSTLSKGAGRGSLEALIEDVVCNPHGLGMLRSRELSRVQVGIRAEKVRHRGQRMHAREGGRMQEVRVVPLAASL